MQFLSFRMLSLNNKIFCGKRPFLFYKQAHYASFPKKSGIIFEHRNDFVFSTSVGMENWKFQDFWESVLWHILVKIVWRKMRFDGKKKLFWRYISMRRQITLLILFLQNHLFFHETVYVPSSEFSIYSRKTMVLHARQD